MEGNDWYSRTGYTDYRNHYRGDDQPLDPSVFRGAYRLDTDSNHHNQTTYSGFDRSRRPDEQQGGDYIYNRTGGMRHEDVSRSELDRVHSNLDQNYDQDNRFRRDRDEQYRPHSGGYGTRFGDEERQGYRSERDWNRDRYNDRYNDWGRERYGNTAGSLSFGYDGDYYSQQERSRHFDPLSGRMQNRPHRYGPPDEFGMNPDYDRY